MNWYKISKTEDKFVYDNLLKDFWRELLFLEKKRLKIAFDLENNDSCGNIKDIEIDKVFIKGGNKRKYKLSAEMMAAGGDWENPVRYFKVQCASKSEFTSGWGKFNKGEFSFIYIPEPKDGNKHLRKSNDKKWDFQATQDEADYFKFDNKDEKKLWDALKKHCIKRIEEYYNDRYFAEGMGIDEVCKKHGIYDKYDLHRVF